MCRDVYLYVKTYQGLHKSTNNAMIAREQSWSLSSDKVIGLGRNTFFTDENDSDLKPIIQYKVHKLHPTLLKIHLA